MIYDTIVCRDHVRINALHKENDKINEGDMLSFEENKFILINNYKMISQTISVVLDAMYIKSSL